MVPDHNKTGDSQEPKTEAGALQTGELSIPAQCEKTEATESR